MTAFSIRSVAHYLPRTAVPSTEIDARLDLTPGTTERRFGIRERRVAALDETSSVMAAAAALRVRR